MPELTREDGFPTGAIHAFFAGILKLTSMDVPHSTAIFFDKGGSNRHREIFAEYKANRSEMPEPLRKQIPEIMELCRLMGFCVIVREGVEADDLLAAAAEKLAVKDALITVVSADKDFAQLVRPGIRQLLPPAPQKQALGWRELDMVGVKTKFGVSPAEIPYYLALVGDTADNIPGIPGVGPKTAAKWIKEYGDIESIIRRSDWLKPDKFRATVAGNAGILRRNLELVTLDKSADFGEIECSAPDFDAVIEFLEKMEMKRSVGAFKKFAKEQYQTIL
jgi:DNA polymerase-1